jgi:hypothetical protein
MAPNQRNTLFHPFISPSRIAPSTGCFCGHSLSDHALALAKNDFRCRAAACACRRFEYVPHVPEEIGEWWLNTDGSRRAAASGRGRIPGSGKQRAPLITHSSSAAESSVETVHESVSACASASASAAPPESSPIVAPAAATRWRAKCRVCRHDHLAHMAGGGARRCTARACRCGAFEPGYACIACERPGAAHETVFETESERRAAQNCPPRPVGDAYRPLHEIADRLPPVLAAIVGGGAERHSHSFELSDPRHLIPISRSAASGNESLFPAPSMPRSRLPLASNSAASSSRSSSGRK